MEFIKINKDRHLIKDSNNIIVSAKEKLELEKKELTKRKIEYAKKTGNYNYLPSGYGVLNGKIVKTK